MEHWWNDNDRGKPKYLEKGLSRCHFIYHRHLISCLFSWTANLSVRRMTSWIWRLQKRPIFFFLAKQMWNWTERPILYGSCNFQYFHFRNCCIAGKIHFMVVTTSLSNYVTWLITTPEIVTTALSNYVTWLTTTVKNSGYYGVCINRRNISGFRRSVVGHHLPTDTT